MLSVPRRESVVHREHFLCLPSPSRRASRTISRRKQSGIASETPAQTFLSMPSAIKKRSMPNGAAFPQKHRHRPCGHPNDFLSRGRACFPTFSKRLFRRRARTLTPPEKVPTSTSGLFLLFFMGYAYHSHRAAGLSTAIPSAERTFSE